MAVILVPSELRERLGDAGSESLVDLLRQVGGEQREDLIAVVEERFARRVMEARDELRSEMHTGFMDLQQQIGGVRAELGDARAEFQEQIGGVRAELQEQIGSVRAELQEQIGSVRAELQEQIGGVRAELQEQIGSVRAELQEQIGGVRAELHKEIGTVHQEIGQVRKEITVQTRWLVTVMVAATILIPVMQKVLAVLIP